MVADLTRCVCCPTALREHLANALGTVVELYERTRKSPLASTSAWTPQRVLSMSAISQL